MPGSIWGMALDSLGGWMTMQGHAELAVGSVEEAASKPRACVKPP